MARRPERSKNTQDGTIGLTWEASFFAKLEASTFRVPWLRIAPPYASGAELLVKLAYFTVRVPAL
jgi:hypothetical protein